MAIKDLSNMKFGMLTVSDRYEVRKRSNGKSYTYWLCKCECGRKLWVRGVNLSSGNTKGCGHHRPSYNGNTKKRLYTIYNNMKQRCYNPRNTNYKYYGGKGITICDEWMGQDGFSVFENWALDNGYSDELTIDRVNFNLGYTPDNCRWVDMKSQVRNRSISPKVDGISVYDLAEENGIKLATVDARRKKYGFREGDLMVRPNKRIVHYQGKDYTIKELSEITGIKIGTLNYRYEHGCTDEDIVKSVLPKNRKHIQRTLTRRKGGGWIDNRKLEEL